MTTLSEPPWRHHLPPYSPPTPPPPLPQYSGGTLGGILPLLAIFYAAMLRSWTGAVDDLADHYDPSHAHRVSVAGSIDEEDDVAPLGGDVAGQGSELQPAPAL